MVTESTEHPPPEELRGSSGSAGSKRATRTWIRQAAGADGRGRRGCRSGILKYPVALSLGKYADAVIAQGWDCLIEFKEIASEQLCALAVNAAMPPGHTSRLAKALHITLPAPAPEPAPAPAPAPAAAPATAVAHCTQGVSSSVCIYRLGLVRYTVSGKLMYRLMYHLLYQYQKCHWGKLR